MAWAAVLAAAAYFIFRDAFRYLDYSAEAYRHHWDLRMWLIPHILGAGPAILAGPFQFSTRLRTGWPAVHRAIGYVYVFGGLVAAPAALLDLALSSTCRPCAPPLAILAVLWFTTTAVAFWSARRRSFQVHRQFMIRSYVLMCAFSVIIRLTDFVSRSPSPSRTGTRGEPSSSGSAGWFPCW